jgi:hypothetical protein
VRKYHVVREDGQEVFGFLEGSEGLLFEIAVGVVLDHG